mmetsp:Transcript_60389/g.72603  ORF Transcript_60389/g.72603 Transcript_60389/m.72603 type:complete len:189 (-) Transcript_60389:55-621(-)
MLWHKPKQWIDLGILHPIENQMHPPHPKIPYRVRHGVVELVHIPRKTLDPEYRIGIRMPIIQFREEKDTMIGEDGDVDPMARPHPRILIPVEINPGGTVPRHEGKHHADNLIQRDPERFQDLGLEEGEPFLEPRKLVDRHGIPGGEDELHGGAARFDFRGNSLPCGDDSVAMLLLVFVGEEFGHVAIV